MATAPTKHPVTPNPSVTIDGKKFLWDGSLFATCDEARRQAEAYKNNNFEVRMVEVDGSYIIYTRRLVKEVVVTTPS